MNRAFAIILYYFMISNLVHAQFDPNTTVFVVNQIPGSEIQNKVKGTKKGFLRNLFGGNQSNESNQVQLDVPILQDDGSYQNVTINSNLIDKARTLKIDDFGDINVVTDTANNFVLTQDQIRLSDNITCSPTSGNCSIKPFVLVLGEKVLTADEFIFGYQENGDVIISGGQVKNMTLTGDNTRTTTGESVVQISFSKNERLSNSIDAYEAVLDLPSVYKEQEFLRIDVGTSELSHYVRNPENPSEEKKQWEVKDGGVSSSLIITNEEHLVIQLNGQTHGGITYDSDPFSEQSVTLDTNSPVQANFVVIDDPNNPLTSLSVAMGGTNTNGDTSKLTLVDNRNSERTDTITAEGQTFLNLSSNTGLDERNRPFVDDEPVAFELGSDKLNIINEYSNGQRNEASIEGLRAVGSVNPDGSEVEIGAIADQINFQHTNANGNTEAAGVDGDVRAYIYENDQTRLIQGMANHAYYNNGETVIDITGGIAVQVQEWKEPSDTRPTFNGRPVHRDAVIIGNQADISYQDTNVSVSGGFGARQINFADNGSTLTMVEGSQGQLTSKNYQVNLDDNFRALSYQDDKGKLKAAEVGTGQFSAQNTETNDQLSVLTSSTSLNIERDNETDKDTLFIMHTSSGVEYRRGDGSYIANAGQIQGQAVISDDIKFGVGTFNDVSLIGEPSENGGAPPTITFQSIEAAVYQDSTNPNNTITEGLFGIENMNAQNADFNISVVAKDEFGNEGKFFIYYVENENGRKIEIFGEDGKRVNLEADDINKNQHYSVLVEAVKYIETDQFKYILANNVSGEISPIENNDPRLTQFNIARIEGIESIDGSFRQFQLDNGQLRHLDGSQEVALGFETATFTQTNTMDTETIMATAQNGYFSFIEYAEDNGAIINGTKITEGEITFGSIIAARMQVKGEKPTTVFSANNLNLIAVDYNNMLQLNGQIGSINFFDNANITAIEANDLRNFNIDDNENNISALFNGQKVVRVVERDNDGNEIGSYLLVDSATLEVAAPNEGINANIRVGVFEYLKDELSGQHIYLDVDVSGKVTYSGDAVPFNAEANFSAKAQNVTTVQESYVSDDGSTVTEYFAIKAVNEEGGIDHLSLSAGPSFLKDAISLEAKGGENGGKELSFTFHQDKTSGTYYIKAAFKEGEKVKIKMFPFTLESKQIGNEAIADLLISPKGQNYLNHLQIITGVIDTHEITSWLGISDGGMIVLKTPTLAGFGIEMMYQDQNNFFPAMTQFHANPDVAKSIGIGVFHEAESGNRTSAGLMLTGDSEIGYHTNGKFKIFGFDMGKQGRIPATVNIYAKREFASGDAIMGNISYDLTSLLVDENYLSPNCSYFNNGRGIGGAGASISYKKQLGEQSSVIFSVGANQNFTNPTAAITFRYSFGQPLNRQNRRNLRNVYSTNWHSGY